MIRTDKGTIRIEGSGAEVLADYSVITLQLRKILVESGFTEEEAKNELQDCLDMAFKHDTSKSDLEHMKSKLEAILELLKGVESHE